MSTKHTPGPWRAEHGMVYAGDERIAFVPAPSIGIPQREANAALIAAAPALEQACKDARAWGIELASLLPDERELRFRRLWPKINDVLRLALPWSQQGHQFECRYPTPGREVS